MGAEGRFAQRDLGIGFTADWQLRNGQAAVRVLGRPG